METDFSVITDHFYEQGFSVSENFLSVSEIDMVLSKIHELQIESAFKKAGIGNKDQLQQNNAIRNDVIYWIDPLSEVFKNVFFSKLDDLVLSLNRRCFLGLNDSEFHLAHYAPGNFYKKHRDAFKTDDARKISVICYLNKHWKPSDGGQLLLYPGNSEPIRIEPLAGRLVIFESHLEHEVLISHADRYSITGWLKNKSRPF